MASSFKNNHNFNEFYESWMSKLKDLEPHEAQKLTDFYDKFFTLYVVYNFLYAIVARKNDVAREKEEAKEYKDKKAVKDDIKLCRDFQDKIDEITNLLKTGQFYVVEDDRDENGKIIRKLESVNDINQRASGILEVIYGVRCNLFHGKKLFQPSQEKILSPLNSLLEGIIKKIYAKLLEN